MERRSRRRRRRRDRASKGPKPLSIDMLKNKRHKKNKSKRIAAVRLDLEDSGGFSGGMLSQDQLLSKIVALLIVVAALTAIAYDYGFDKITEQVSTFAGNGATKTINSSSETGSYGAASAIEPVANLQGEATPSDTHAQSMFYPDGNAEAISRIQLALDTAKIGLTSEAMKLLDEAKILDPDVTGLDYIRATIYQRAGKTIKAREYYKLAQQHKATRFLAHLEQGKVELQEKNYPEAVDHLRVARQLKPEDPAIASALSRALRLNGQPQEGLFEAQAARQMNPEMRIYEVEATLAEIQAGVYEPTSEISRLLTLDQIDSTTSPYLLVIAAAWEKVRGNREKVKELWDAILPHSITMKWLRELQQDPVFVLDPIDQLQSVTAKQPAHATKPVLSNPSETLQHNTNLSEDTPAPDMDLDFSIQPDIPQQETDMLNLRSTAETSDP